MTRRYVMIAKMCYNMRARGTLFFSLPTSFFSLKYLLSQAQLGPGAFLAIDV